MEPDNLVDIKSRYGIAASILIGCLFIATSIVLATVYFVNNNKVVNLNTENEVYDIDLGGETVYLGESNAEVNVVEFADYQCPFCKKFTSQILPQLKKQYIDTGKVKFYYFDFAFLGDESIRAAEAAMCAKDQGKFWEYHDSLYTNQKSENSGVFVDSNLKQLAKNLGLDTVPFDHCLDSNTNLSKVEEDISEATQKYDVNSTPTLFVNGKKIEGLASFSEYEREIELALKE